MWVRTWAQRRTRRLAERYQWVVVDSATTAGQRLGRRPGARPTHPRHPPPPGSRETFSARRAASMSRDAANTGAIAFKRSGDLNVGTFDDATILRTFGEIPENLDEL